MLRNILVGLDGSEHSASAMELCIRWSRQFDILLVGLGIVDEPAIRSPAMTPIGGNYYKELSDDARVEHSRKQVDQFLERFALRCTEAKVSHKLLEVIGDPCSQIVLAAQQYDLIALGQQTHFQFATQDTSDAFFPTLLKNSPRPVVVVPQKLTDGKSVVIAYDGSLQAARTLYAFQASGLGQIGEVLIISIGTDHVATVRDANCAVEFLSFHGIKATPLVLTPSPSVADVILTQAKQLDAQLVVIGAYGQSTLREFFFGSVTRNVLRNTEVPLFLYH